METTADGSPCSAGTSGPLLVSPLPRRSPNQRRNIANPSSATGTSMAKEAQARPSLSSLARYAIHRISPRRSQERMPEDEAG